LFNLGLRSPFLLSILSHFCIVADPNPGSGDFLTPESESGMENKPVPGSGINIPDHISESLVPFRDPVWKKIQIRDPGKNIPDP
jgi:hypothetical protein